MFSISLCFVRLSLCWSPVKSMVSVPLNIQVFSSLLDTSESNCTHFFTWSLNCIEALILLSPYQNCPTWHIWWLGLYFSRPNQSEVHRITVTKWYIPGVPLFCHLKMINCQPITEILFINPEVHDSAIRKIIPHPSFLVHSTLPVLYSDPPLNYCFPCFVFGCSHSSSSDWHKPSISPHHMPYIVPHNYCIEVDLCFICIFLMEGTS